MAEVAAGAVVAEQVVSTGIEAGAAVAVAQPALPLRASFHQIASAQAQDDSLELARSHHTTTVLGNKAYIFGGKSGDKTLCSNNLSGIALPVNNQPPGGSEYVCYPAVSLNEAVPPPRFSHAACARDDTLVVHGGRGDDESPLDESCLWLWSSKTLQWDKLSFVGKIPPPRYGHRILPDEEQDILILHGGFGTNGPVTETWLFDFKSYEWTELPSAPEATLASQLVNSTLFAISGSSDVNGSIHVLQLDPLSREKALKEELEWSTFDFPTNPLTPGPRPRTGGALVPVTTGLGRHYLISILGSRRDVEMTSSNQDFTKSHPFYSDVWALQLPSAGYSASQAKDTVRDYLPGFESGSLSWGEISFTSTESTNTTAQNHHPGPRAYFGADICPDGKNVFIWGGLNTKEERQADGWLLRVE